MLMEKKNESNFENLLQKEMIMKNKYKNKYKNKINAQIRNSK